MFQLAQYTAQLIPSGASTALSMDQEVADPWQVHADDSDTSQVVIPPGLDGIWLVQGSVPYNTSSSGHYYAAQLLHTGAASGSTSTISGTRLQSNGAHVTPQVADLISVDAGDVIQLAALQTSGASINTWASESAGDIARYDGQACPVLTGRWVAAGNSLPGGVLQTQLVTMFDGPAPVYGTAGIQMQIPNLPTWADGDEISNGALNGSITGCVMFLSNVPACRTFAGGTPAAVRSGQLAQVTGLQATIDGWADWNAATNTWTAPKDGVYLLFGQCGWPQQSAAFTASTALNCSVSGSPVTFTGTPATAVSPCASVLRQVRLSAGDTVQVRAAQNSGSTLTPSTLTNTRFFSLWLSA
jgi:hypothetical protein